MRHDYPICVRENQGEPVPAPSLSRGLIPEVFISPFRRQFNGPTEPETLLPSGFLNASDLNICSFLRKLFGTGRVLRG